MECEVRAVVSVLIMFVNLVCTFLAVFSSSHFCGIQIWKLLHNEIEHISFHNNYSQMLGNVYRYVYF
jgi:hypothetical protein